MKQQCAIFGSAETLWSDLVELQRDCGDEWFYDLYDIIVVNFTIEDWPYRVDYFCTSHPTFFDLSPYEKLITVDHRHTSDHHTVYAYSEQTASTSGGLALTFALDYYSKIVLCGIPMEGTNMYNEEKVDHYTAVQWTWEQAFHDKRDRIKSYSGWTKEFFNG